jgi:hypothetical protein
MYLSLLNHTVILYDKKLILEELNMNDVEFREIMVLSGTDYNIDSNTNLYETLKWHSQYNKYLLNCFQNGNKQLYTFYVWLFKNTKYISDFNKLLRAYQLFSYGGKDLFDWKNIEIVEKSEDLSKLRDVMGKEGFLFAR